MKGFILFCLTFMSFVSVSNVSAGDQIDRGTLLMKKNSKIIENYIDKDGLIKLSETRNICRFFIDSDQVITLKKNKKILLKKRKKAFKRHTKILCEKLENAYQLKKQVDPSLEDIILELELFKVAIISKTISDYKGVTLLNKINMKINGSLSSWKTQYLTKLYKEDKEALNIEYKLGESKESLSIKDPDSSVFWHKQEIGKLRYKNFKRLEKLKKIKVKNNMVVLFDKPSLDGSAPKIKALDLDLDNAWSIKWGDELHTDVLGSRIFAAFGYDVDHPYIFGKDKVTVVFPENGEYTKAQDLIKIIQSQYKVNLTRFISKYGIITQEMVETNNKLKDFKGQNYVTFNKCVLEARSDRVKRVGHMATGALLNGHRRELRGSTLLHMWIGNWDTREENTMLTTVHMGNHKYRASAAFNDLGTSFGMHVNSFPTDFKAGLVNKFSYHLVKSSRNLLLKKTLKFKHVFNHFNSFFKQTTYSDLRWMALKLEKLSSDDLKKMIKKAAWPKPIAQLYYNKLASRRDEILKVFAINQSLPWTYTKTLNMDYKGEQVVKNGVLIKEIDPELNPEGFIHTHGRFRNYGDKK